MRYGVYISLLLRYNNRNTIREVINMIGEFTSELVDELAEILNEMYENGEI